MKFLKCAGLGVTAFFVFGVLMLAPVLTPTATAMQEASAANAAEFYNAKCKMCHGAKAEKKFDAALPEDQMIEAVLKGKKVEKPPNMPEYGSKGVTAEQAKGLIDYMKQLKAGS